MEGLDDRLLSSIDRFFDGMHNSDMDAFLLDWSNVDKAFFEIHDEGSLDSTTSSLAVGVSDCMNLLCDAFMNLEVKTAGLATEFRRDLERLSTDNRNELTTSRSPSLSQNTHSSTSTNILPPHIPPCHTWLLSNLHNPYPSLPTRDSIASSTNTDRRIIDSWFVDVRRRIGWTALVESGRERDTKRRKTSLMLGGMGATQGRRSGLKYRSRNELISAASRFFLPSSSSSSSSSSSAHHSNHTTLTPLEIQTFSALQNAAHALYKDKGLSMKKEGSPEVSQSPKSTKKRRGSSSSATTAPSIKQEESSSDVEEDDDVEHGNGARRYKRSRFSPRSVSPAESSITTSSESYVTTPTDGSFPFHTPYANSNTFSNTSSFSSFSSTSTSSPTPSSSPSQTPSLKRKRAVSAFDEYPSTPTPTSSSFSSSFSSSTFSTSPVSPATKRLRTALNGAGVLRSVSDPTPVPLFTSTPASGSGSGSGSGLGNSGFTQPLTFDGFSASALDAWFSGIGTGTGTGSVESGKDVSGEWIDPFFLGLPDPVVHQTQPEAPTQNQTQTQGEAASSSSVPLSTSVPVPSTIPPPIVPYPLDINVNVNVNIGDLSSYSSSYSYSSPSSSSPSTPALSASGTLTDDTDTDTDTDTEGDDDERDSLFGDHDHDRDGQEDHAVLNPTPTPGDILNQFHAKTKSKAQANTPRDISTDFPPAFPLNVNIDLTSFPDLSNFPELAQFPDFSEFNIDGLPGIGDLDRSKAATSNANLPHLRQQHGDLQEGHLPLPGLNLSLDDTGDLGNTHTHTDTRDIHSSRVGSGTGNGIAIEDGREKEDKVGTHADLNSNSNSNPIPNSNFGLGRDLGTAPGYGYEPRYGFGFGFGFENEPVPLVLDGFGLGSENQFGLGGVGELGDSGLDLGELGELGELSELGGGVNVVAGNLGSLGSLWAGPTPTRETFGVGVGVASLV